MSAAETSATQPLKRPPPFTPDYLTLPFGIFAEDRKIVHDGAIWWFGVAGSKLSTPKFIGIWKGLDDTGYRLPDADRPLASVFKDPKIQAWLEWELGGDAALVHVPDSRDECEHIVKTNLPYTYKR
jgi:hypothetical protein